MPGKTRLSALIVAFTLWACAPDAARPAASGGTETAAPTPSPSPAPTGLPSPLPSKTTAPTATPGFIPYTTPGWFQNGILYEIYVRSFADSDGDGVGDLQGITAQLDYIESLHVDVIWLMPIHPTTTVHGYDVIDFFSVNPEYGTLEDLQELVGELHKRDIRLTLDFVASHVSSQHPFFQDALGNPDSSYDDWFHFTDDSNTAYEAFSGLGYLPRLNHFNPAVVDHLTEAALFWMDLDGDGDYADGVDGFRIDNATFPPRDFFVAWRQAVKRADPDALILGEVALEQVAVLGPYFPDQFDALFNFPLQNLFSNAGGLDDAGEYTWNMPPSLITARISRQLSDYPQDGILVQFLSNHDTDRLASALGGDAGLQKFAAAFSLILPEAYALYYGEEIGMFGVQGGPPHYDSYRREPMDWYADRQGPLQTTWFQVSDRWNVPGDGVSVEEQVDDPGSLLSTYRRLLALRAGLPALKGGEFVDLEAVAVGRKAWAVSRTNGDQTLVGIYNFGPQAVEITIPVFPFSSGSLTDLIAGGVYPGATAGEPYLLALAGETAVWFISQE